MTEFFSEKNITEIRIVELKKGENYFTSKPTIKFPKLMFSQGSESRRKSKERKKY